MLLLIEGKKLMSELIRYARLSKTSADLIREYALDHYVHYGFLPSDVEVDGHVFDYETYNYYARFVFPRIS